MLGMRNSLLRLMGLAGLLNLGAAQLGPALGGELPQFPGVPDGLPEGWRDLGRGLSPPREGFDFGFDRFRAQPDGSDRVERRDLPYGSNGAADRAKEKAASRAAKSKAAQAERLKKALAPHETPIALRRRSLDELFTLLRAAPDAEEAQGAAEAIETIWLKSPSPTAELLMRRALTSIQQQNYALAVSLLDKVVALEPEWAEAWNQRGMARFLSDDIDGAMGDIDRVMKLEPRHYGALAGMGLILQRVGLDKRALEIFDKALAIYPLQSDLRKTVEMLRLQVEGRDI